MVVKTPLGRAENNAEEEERSIDDSCDPCLRPNNGTSGFDGVMPFPTSPAVDDDNFDDDDGGGVR
jgi:hypothetical protein